MGQEVQLSDLENVDVLLTRSMQDIRTIDQKGKKDHNGYPLCASSTRVLTPPVCRAFDESPLNNVAKTTPVGVACS